MEFEFITATEGAAWPRIGERVRVELADGSSIEGQITSWSGEELVVRTTPTQLCRPRWTAMRRVWFLDRPRRG